LPSFRLSSVREIVVSSRWNDRTEDAQQGVPAAPDHLPDLLACVAEPRPRGILKGMSYAISIFLKRQGVAQGPESRKRPEFPSCRESGRPLMVGFGSDT
jgi:hypothetical protein